MFSHPRTESDQIHRLFRPLVIMQVSCEISLGFWQLALLLRVPYLTKNTSV